MINHGNDEVCGRPTPTEKRHGDLHAFAERERFDKILTADLNMTVQTAHECRLWFTTYTAGH